MPRCFLDHITVTTPSLGLGARLVQEALGVAPQPGGEHPRMGTHNLLLRLGDTMFLEVIAPNPGAAAPGRPRWFALDALGPSSQPSLAAWVVRTADIHATARAASEPLGAIEPMTRGALDWLISIPPDGSLPLGGAGPALIEWHAATHPAGGLDDHGLSLAQLTIFHPEPARVERLMRSLELDAPVSVSAGAVARLVAYINTPGGIRTLPLK